MSGVDNIRTIIIRELSGLIEEESGAVREISETDDLVDLGLDSLAFAVLLTRLEEFLGIDPFVAIEQGAPPRSVGDLLDAYTLGS